MTSLAYKAAATLVIFDGQSLNNNPYGAASTAWPYKLMDGTGVPYGEVWVGGEPFSVLAATETDRLSKYANAATLVCLSMMGDTTSIALGAAATTVYSTRQTYAADARTLGCNKVIGFTLQPSSDFSAAEETQRQSLNALIIANSGGSFDAVVDLTTDSRLESNPADTTYYIDGTHMTPAAHTIVADLARPVFVAAGLIT